MSVFKRYNLVSKTELENTKWLKKSAEKSADVDQGEKQRGDNYVDA
jgi:hypothetical protein